MLLFQWVWQYVRAHGGLVRKSKRDRLACIPFFFFSALAFVKAWQLGTRVDYVTVGLAISLIILNVSILLRLDEDFDTGPTPWQRRLRAYWELHRASRRR